MTIKIKHKRGTASSITTANPTLAAGELAFETDTRRFKVGDGTTAWSSLSYVTPYVTATDRILGRSSAGAGSAEEITCTAAGRALLSGADAAAQRTTLSVQPTASPAFTGAATFAVSSGSSVPVTITNEGTGNSFVVNDAPATDSTPFVIDASGNVGIGTSSPGVKLEVARASPADLGAVARFYHGPASDRSVEVGVFNSAGLNYPPYIQGRATTTTAHGLALQPDGGVLTVGGQLLVTTGSASACGVAFSGDPDTGIAQLSAAGANTLSICTNSAERVRVDASGNVGIGGAAFYALDVQRTSANAILNVQTTTSGNAQLRIECAGNASSTITQNRTSNNLEITNGSSGSLVFTNNGSERMRIDASGNVGVGNIVPTHRIDCNGEFRLRGTGASTEAGKLHLYWVSNTNRATWTTDASGNALIETGSSAPAERFRVGVNGRSQFFAASEKYGVQLNNGSTANGPFIGSDGADILTVSTSGGAERLRVKATGSVRFVPLSADPSTGNEAGDVYYNSSTNKLRVYNGTSWVDLH